MLPIATAADPGSTTTVPVKITLAADAAPDALGLVERDITTVHADGGFTDAAKGQITLATAPPAPPVTPTTPPPTDLSAAPTDVLSPASASLLATSIVDVPATTSTSPSAAAPPVA
nr:hypothetical protein [Pseudonocardiales bacterium]